MEGDCARPAYAANATLGHLRVAELVVICALRLWVQPYCNPGAEHGDWREVFTRARIASSGAAGFDQLVEILAATATRRLDIHDLRCPALGADEGRLLQTLRLLQHGRLAAAAAILGAFLPPSAVRLAIGPAQAFAAALAASGLSIPLRHIGAMTPDPRLPGSHAYGSGLVH